MPMMAMTVSSSSSVNPLRRTFPPMWRPSRFARTASGQDGEAGLRSLRDARLAGRFDLLGERGLAFDRDVGAEALERLAAEAFDLHQIGGFGERAVCRAVLDDPLRGLHADARQKLQLRGIRRVDVDHAGRRGGRLRVRRERGSGDRGNEKDGDEKGEGLSHGVSPFDNCYY